MSTIVNRLLSTFFDFLHRVFHRLPLLSFPQAPKKSRKGPSWLLQRLDIRDVRHRLLLVYTPPRNVKSKKDSLIWLSFGPPF